MDSVAKVPIRWSAIAIPVLIGLCDQSAMASDPFSRNQFLVFPAAIVSATVSDLFAQNEFLVFPAAIAGATVSDLSAQNEFLVFSAVRSRILRWISALGDAIANPKFI